MGYIDVYWGYNPLILTIDPNFLGHPTDFFQIYGPLGTVCNSHKLPPKDTVTDREHKSPTVCNRGFPNLQN